MRALNDIEYQVLRLLLAGDDPVLVTLRNQAEQIIVKKREYTGSGFYTEFLLPNNITRVPNKKSFKFGNVAAKISGLKHGAGFLLYVKDGVLEMLEGYSYEETWPEIIETFEVYYLKGPARDIETVRSVWINAT